MNPNFKPLVFIGIVLATVAAGFCQISKRDSLAQALQSAVKSDKKIELLNSISEWYIRVDFRKAVSYAEEALAISDTTSDLYAKAKAITHRALIYWYNGEYKMSIQLNNEALSLRQKIDDRKGIAVNYQKLAYNYYYMADYEEAIHYNNLALNEFRLSGNTRQVASTLNQIALVYNKLGEYDKAANYLYAFAKERQKFEGYQGRTYNLVKSTPFFRSKEYFQIELELQLKALEELLEDGSDINILFTYLNIADSYRELEKYDKALANLKRANEYYNRVGWMPNYHGFGNAYLRLGKIDSAILQFKLGVKVASEKGTKITLMSAYTGLGESLYKGGRTNEGLKHLLTGFKMTTEMGNRLDMVLTQQRLVEIYITLNDLKSALANCDESIELARKISAKKEIRDGLFQKSRILNSLGEYKEALEIYSEAHLLSDSLTLGEADLMFANMQTQMEVDKKNRDINELNQQKALQEAQLKNKDLLIYGVILVMALSVLLAFSVYLRFRQKSRANKILLEQKHQIETLLAEIHHRVKNNLQVISSLLSIQSSQLTNKNAKMAVLEGQSRVQAMGFIHENIYKAESFAFIDMNEYLKKLGTFLAASFGAEKIEIQIETGGLSVDVDTAIPLGLIVNELLTNSLKHAFDEVLEPKIEINLKLDQNNLLSLRIMDNGRGLMVSTNKESFGLKLVKELAAQLRGTVEFVNGQGFCVELKFKKFKLAA